MSVAKSAKTVYIEVDSSLSISWLDRPYKVQGKQRRRATRRQWTTQYADLLARTDLGKLQMKREVVIGRSRSLIESVRSFVDGRGTQVRRPPSGGMKRFSNRSGTCAQYMLGTVTMTQSHELA